MVNREVRGAKYLWLALPLVFGLACLIPIACQVNHQAVWAKLPLGSRLADLDKAGKFYEWSSVTEWSKQDPGNGIGPVDTDHGTFYSRNLGDYTDWKPSERKRETFTGRIDLYHQSSVIPDDLAPSYHFTLIYVNGVLIKRDYGHLPG